MRTKRIIGSMHAARRRLRADLTTGAFVARLMFGHASLPGGLLLALQVLQGAAGPLVVWAMAGLINAVLQLSTSSSGPWNATAPWLAALLVGLLLRDAGGGAHPWLAAIIRERIERAVYHQIYAKAIALPLATFQKPDYYTKLETGRQALGGALIGWIGELTGLIGATAGLAGLLVLYAQASRALAILLLATAILQGVLSARLSQAFGAMRLRNSPLRRERVYWSGLLASREAAPELRLFGLAEHLSARMRTLSLLLLTDLLAVRRRIAVQMVAQAVLRELVGLSVLLFLLLLALRREISLGELVALLYGLSQVRELLWDVARISQQLGEFWLQMAHLRAFLDLADEPVGAHQLPGILHDGVAFEDVSFSYPGSAQPSLQHVAFRLRPGEHVALVGENGAGKTTLVRLLLGLYRPTAGRITVDGIDLTDLDPKAWRRIVTAVFQDFVRYPTSVVENIGYADASLLVGDFLHAPPHPRIVAAAQRSAADGFIAHLPTGYATLLGKEFAAAVDLSAGQWQRLALARAYLRDAQIVVLDEPTAALGPRGEVAVYRQFAAAATGRCAVFISHRLGSARLADRIVVLHSGGIAEEGSHEALLAQGGEYARMYRLQASWYAPIDHATAPVPEESGRNDPA